MAIEFTALLFKITKYHDHTTIGYLVRCHILDVQPWIMQTEDITNGGSSPTNSWFAKKINQHWISPLPGKCQYFFDLLNAYAYSVIVTLFSCYVFLFFCFFFKMIMFVITPGNLTWKRSCDYCFPIPHQSHLSSIMHTKNVTGTFFKIISNQIIFLISAS